MPSKTWAVLPLLLQLGDLVNGAIYKTDFPGVTWNQDKWQLTTTNLQPGQFQTRGSVANGYLGINVASAGPFFEEDVPGVGDVISGWPLFSRRQSFATVAGFWDSQPLTAGTNFPWLSQYGGESVISGVPHWSGLILDLGSNNYLDATVDPTTISNFTSTYDYKSGVLNWHYTWTPQGNHGSFAITYRLFVHKLYVNQAVVDMEIIPSQKGAGQIANVFDGFAAVRTNFVKSGQDNGAIFSAVSPNGMSNVTAYIYANMTGSPNVDMASRKISHNKPYVHTNASTIAQTVNVNFTPGQAVRVTKFVGGASSDAFANPQQTAKQGMQAAQTNGYTKSLQRHMAEWAAVLPADSVDSYVDPSTGKLPADPNIIDSQIIAVTNPYYLLQNTVSQNAQKAVSGALVNVDSIAVGGLTSDSYAGQVFWDADVWMQPGLVAAHPIDAQRITNYRQKLYAQAKKNIQTAFESSQSGTTFSPGAAIYPWTSARFGNCTSVGPCWDYEYHINGDIGLALVDQLVASGDTKTFQNKLFPIYDSVATMYANLLQPNGSSWTLTNMTDPDEYANHVDAGGYTMPLIAETLSQANTFRQQFGQAQNATWNQMASNVLVLRENGVTLEFTTMNGSAVVKQADVVLDTYPLSYTSHYSQQDSLNDLDYYANKQSPDGPAMTYAIFSVVANQMSPSGCSAYTYSMYSFLPYTRAPFYQLSEQLIDNPNLNGGTHPAYPFLTGHGGANQVVLFGYLGYRQVADGFLHVDPNLPPQIPYLKYRTFFWRGWPISAESNYTHTTISRSATTAPLASADPTYAGAITIHSGTEQNFTTYTLPASGSVVIPNRQVGSINTIPGDMVQCQPVSSPDTFTPGQFPISAVDGASSTKWQPSLASNLSAVTVSFPSSEVGSNVRGFYFNWAQAPPKNATVIFHNKTLADPASVYSSGKSSDYTVVTSLSHIKQSNPYNPATVNTIAIPIGNTTNVTLSHPVPAARYASLLITGNQAGGPTGATVAEWAIIGQNKTSGAAAKRSMSLRSRAALADTEFLRRRH